MHHMKAHRLKKKWYIWVGIALIGQIPKRPHSRARVIYTRYCGYIRPDGDGLVSSFKWVQDGIVLAGVLANDRTDNIHAEYRWFPASAKDKKITVEIIPVDHRLHPSDP